MSQEFEIQMNWNMMEFLPENGGVRKYFSDVVASYIHAVYTKLSRSDGEEGAPATPKRRKTTLSQLTQTTPMGVGTRDSIASFAKELLTNELQDKLFL